MLSSSAEWTSETQDLYAEHESTAVRRHSRCQAMLVEGQLLKKSTGAIHSHQKHQLQAARTVLRELRKNDGFMPFQCWDMLEDRLKPRATWQYTD